MNNSNKSDTIDLPVELILPINKSIKEDEFISKSIVNFFDLGLTNPKADLAKTKKLIDYLNFIRFAPRASTQNEPQAKSTSRINVPTYSIILLTNSPNQKILLNQNEPNPETPWSYHHKIELNDENGQTIARQIFFKLNLFTKPNSSIRYVPLCCRSNWLPPVASTQNQHSSSSFHKKYITRLNINCKNYDLMLFFYRLLFDKYPNFSKKISHFLF